MAQYKVIQDIEAEDKLVGPLTLRQFIYAAIAALCMYLSFLSFTKHAQFLLIIFLPIVGVMGFFAFPWRRDQPTEVWALAKIRYVLKPHRRIWDQSGLKDLVKINAPKKLAQILTKNLTQEEVQSRLSALASTIDTRGWVTKNVNVNLYSPNANLSQVMDSTDRLVGVSTTVPTDNDIDIQASEDIMDENSNPTARHFQQMIDTAEANHRQDLIAQASGQKPKANNQQPAHPDYWFMSQAPQAANTMTERVVVPGDSYGTTAPVPETKEEKDLVEKLKQRKEEANMFGSHMKVIQPPSEETEDGSPNNKQGANSTSKMTTTPDPAILQFASNNDRTVATIAREANQVNKPKEPPKDEVIINLH